MNERTPLNNMGLHTRHSLLINGRHVVAYVEPDLQMPSKDGKPVLRWVVEANGRRSLGPVYSPLQYVDELETMLADWLRHR